MNVKYRAIALSFAFMIATLVGINSLQAKAAAQEQTPTPTQVATAFPYCPHELLCIHFDIYYYSVYKCPNLGVQPLIYGFPGPVVTGCGSNACKHDMGTYPPTVSAPVATATSTNTTSNAYNNIPLDKLPSAEKVYQSTGVSSSVYRYKDSGTQKFYIAVQVTNTTTNQVYRFARQIDVPTGQTPSGTWIAATVDENGQINGFPILIKH